MLVIIKYIKQFFIESWHLPRWEFVSKYIAPVVTIFFLWGAIGSLSELNLHKENLIHVQGKVTDIKNVLTKIIDKPFYKKNEYELKIYLNEYSGYFRLTDNFNNSGIYHNIKVGDTIDIYHRSLMRTILGMGKQYDIYQLEVHGKVLFSIGDRKGNSLGVFIISTFAAIAFGAIAINWIIFMKP